MKQKTDKEKKASGEEVAYLLWMPSSLKEELQELAREEKRTLKGQILLILEEGLKARQPEKVPSL